MSGPTIHTLRAQGCDETVVIVADQDVTPWMQERLGGDRYSAGNLEATKQLYGAEAQKLCDALRVHLPGGLFDALLGAMLHEKATIFTVSHEKATL